jgi:co-chaperonin GroES (HSP10)
VYSAQIKEMAETILPVPTGYKILVAMPKVEAKTEGGIWRPDQLIQLEQTASIFGCVTTLGPDAYANTDKYPSGPWCKPGDWVVFRSYSGTRFKIDGQEYRLINDDTVEAVVDDPRKIERAF